jgi:quercetin dioxygenase-like cupin family protein
MGETEGVYATRHRETIAEAPNLRVRLLALGEGQCVPWHYHNNITDTFFCMEGPMQVTTRDPEQVHVLAPGEIFAVAPGVAHLVAGVDDRPCKFIVIQGVGVYDFVPVG